MRRGLLLAAALAALSGCAQLAAISKSPPKAPAQPPPRPASPAPAAPLRPELSAEEEHRLVEDARRKIDGVERLVRELEGRQMKPPQQEMFRTAKNLLEEAKSAFGARDYQRAANLANKAGALSDDLASVTK